MRMFWVFLLGWSGLLVQTNVAFSQTADLIKQLSSSSNVPLATVVTDLVTKASSNSIISTLQQKTDNNAQSITYPSLDPQAQAQAIKKGYVVRDVEFTSAFGTNVKKILDRGDISLSSLFPRSIFSSSDELVVATSRSAPLPPVASTGLDSDNSRVWTGVPITSTDLFRDTVAIIGNNKICSGTLIAPDLVVTAAHCYCDGVMDQVIFGVSAFAPTDRINIVKEQSLLFTSGPDQAAQRCAQIKQDLSLGDLALMKLEKPTTAPPREIGGLPMVMNSASVRAVGFGQNNSAGTGGVIGVKYQVNIVIASYQCGGTTALNIPDNQVFRCKNPYELVAAGLNRDTCGGDSGGPVYVSAQNTKIYLVGVTSRAVDPNGKCGPGGIYVLLGAPPIRAWLEAQGRKLDDSP
jgi:V8-like Glu-specific endopeptidase